MDLGEKINEQAATIKLLRDQNDSLMNRNRHLQRRELELLRKLEAEVNGRVICGD